MIDFSKYLIYKDATVKDALILLDKLSDDVLTLFVMDYDESMVGTLTEGDIRRKLIEGISMDQTVDVFMNTSFSFLREGEIDIAKIKKLKKFGIKLLPIIDEKGKLRKVINLRNRITALPVDAVLMAGGKGERLRPLTDKTPKPLLKVGDKAIIDYNIERLINYGVENISITVNYLKEKLESHFENPIKATKIHCVREPNYLGTIGSVKFVNHFQNDTVLVMNSDLFTNIDYEDYFLHFTEHNADMSVAAIPYSMSIPYGIFDLDNRNVLGIKEKPTYNYFANAGIYLIKKKLLDLIPDNAFFDATDFMEMLIKKNYNVIRYPLTGYWIDIGKHEDYKKAQELVKHIVKDD